MTNESSDTFPQYPPSAQEAARPGQTPELRCPLCDHGSFRREESREDSRWGFSTHRMTLLICQRCRYVLHFYDANSIWDFD
jgi:hypothetical protein